MKAQREKMLWRSGAAMAALLFGLGGCAGGAQMPLGTAAEDPGTEEAGERTGEPMMRTEELMETTDTARQNPGTEAGDEAPDFVTVNLEEEFGSLLGCAVFYDAAENACYLYNEEACRLRQPPCSTFKVVSALSGLHNGVITSAESRMGYEGRSYSMPEWNTDLTMEEAFRSSCVWYFRKVIDGIGAETVREELEQLGYGNCDVSEWEGSGCNPYPELNGFWLDSSLLISPLEQTAVLSRIFEGESIYTRGETETLKNVMLTKEEEGRRVFGKTGSGVENTGWFVGFEEQEDRRLYFAVYLDDANSESVNGTAAKELALNLLQEADGDFKSFFAPRSDS